MSEMTVEEAVQTLKDLSGSFNVVCYEGGATVLEDAVLVLLVAYDAQRSVINAAFEWRDSLLSRPIPKTGAARNLRLALREYASRKPSL